MKRSFKLGEESIGSLDLTITISSMMIGVGILTLPKTLARVTMSSDGWMSIVLAGTMAIVCAWIMAKLAGRFHGEGYFAYASSIITKPVALLWTTGMSVYYIVFCAFEIRAIANISKQYLFERTPVEIIALTFLLVTVYAAAGSRIGLIRLNTLFLPLVMSISVFVLLFSIPLFHYSDLKPFFITDWHKVLGGAKETVFSVLGFEVVLFYTSLMKRPEDAPKAAMLGVALTVLLYLTVYIIAVGVFSHQALKEVTYPAIELAKEMQVPGEFFERFESIFFTIWIMTIFNTSAMALDVAVNNLSHLFRKMKRMQGMFLLSPVVYLICMFPENGIEFNMLGTLVNYGGIIFVILIPCLMYGVAVIRRRKPHGNT
ncbi:GerAB/ArcD/ProY family transporter [Paenibacillus mucilaginosus]|uniref:Spore germination protein n=2 Tax=Paenibacillus mucilaginosus TaxID=61624 RepID=H6NJG7_9BACL|nr:endospore germination permease [Paenibacillus mucilaginosus]AEI41075.1 spore germination protein [Paenibacillus mucilaginosus KNP414]AFC29647.1 spore germination protein [Paenibacillus mucilaginosus 3016]MCG7211483.1 spore germination protein [Paenibacillus mucilaginosus]WDM30142.1 endospore germination permease [Paenibacillus mucilaginosus]WFA18329.1 spore gernimation protein [Paenibacillus mucilaginosus]